MCDSNCTWLFNLLVVALLIQHVARVAHATEQHVPATATHSSGRSITTTNSFDKVAPSLLVKRHAVRDGSASSAAAAAVGNVAPQSATRIDDMERLGTASHAAAGVDFAAYVNDFNMPEEAAIPEDILDQRHIQDVDVDVIDATDNIQYGDSNAEAVAMAETDVDGAGDDDDDEPEADIILEARRFSTSIGNFTALNAKSYSENNNNNNNWNDDSSSQRSNNNNNGELQVDLHDRRHKRNKLKSNADSLSNDKTDNKSNNNSNSNNKNPCDSAFDQSGTEAMTSALNDRTTEKKGIALDLNGDGDGDDDDSGNTGEAAAEKDDDDDDDFFEEPLALPSSMKFTSLRERNNDKLEVSADKAEQRQEPWQQNFRVIESAVREKLNKPLPHDTGDNKDDHNSNDSNNTNNLQHNKSDNRSIKSAAATAYFENENQLEETAIGDIEDKFRNEDEDGAPAPTTAAPTVIATYKIAGAAANSDETAATSTSTAKQQRSATFIGRKFKRHDRARSSNNSGSNNRRHHYGDQGAYIISNNNNEYSDDAVNVDALAIEGVPATRAAVAKEGVAARANADYSITYFGILTNNTKTKALHSTHGAEHKVKHGHADSQRQGNRNNMDDDNNKTNVEDVAQVPENVAKIADSVVDGAVGANHQRSTHKQTAPAAVTSNSETVHLSAFERFKAQRRNSRRYGHKSYKKKYKDYLRYATKSMPTITTTTTTPTAIAATATGNDAVALSAQSTVNKTPTKLTNNSDDKPEQTQLRTQAEAEAEATLRAHKHAEKLRKYARKIEAEKSRGLPASPIFVVGNRNAAGSNTPTNKPFYEGQINYYLETKDDNAYEVAGNMATLSPLSSYGNIDLDAPHDGADTNLLLSRDERLRQPGRNMERVIAADNNNWYQRVSPVLRNGIKVLSSDGKPTLQRQMAQQETTRHNQQHQTQQQQHSHHQRTPHQHKHQQQHHHQHQHQRQHHHQHARQHQQHSLHHQRSSGSSSSSNNIGSAVGSGSGNHHKHHQHGKHHQSGAAQMNPYQRKLLPVASKGPPSPHAAAPLPVEPEAVTVTQTPIPPPAYRPQRGDAIRQLGHQITEMEEFERYYAKWPHLARVQFQVYDEHYREAHPELYPDTSADNTADYDDDYESAAELEEAQSGHDEDANLPPYIKKYNRRNKQLLNLLEGTLPPPTRPPPIVYTWSSSLLQPGPHDSSHVRLDDDYLKEKRKRYHFRDSGQSNSDDKNARHRYADLFAQQREESVTEVSAAALAADLNGVNTVTPIGMATSPAPTALPTPKAATTARAVVNGENQLPDEDVSISIAEEGDGDTDSDDIWPKEMENKSNANEMTGNAQMTWQIEKLTSPTTAATVADGANTPKAAVYRLPSYPAIAGSFIGKPRSRSAQFAPSGGSRGSLAYVQSASGGSRLSNIYGNNVGGGGSSSSSNNGNSNYHKSLSRYSAYKPNAYKSVSASAAAKASAAAASAAAPSTASAPSAHDMNATPAAAGELGSGNGDGDGIGGGRTISSFVYHRVVDASPRLVGTGATGRKQRLPFVAITDRRLETSKKALLERQKDFEQNHYPMP